MARVPRDVWRAVIVSTYGPAKDRDRHLCHVLDFFMRGDGSDGCFPGQRLLGSMIAADHKTVAASARRLADNGWLETIERRRQYGKTGTIYFSAVPDALFPIIGDALSPISAKNGESRDPQFSKLVEMLSPNGEVRRKIGEFASGIGDPRLPRNTETKLKRAPGPEGGAPDGRAQAVRLLGQAVPAIRLQPGESPKDVVARAGAQSILGDDFAKRFGRTTA
jgi:hypothetical protein